MLVIKEPFGTLDWGTAVVADPEIKIYSTEDFFFHLGWIDFTPHSSKEIIATCLHSLLVFLLSLWQVDAYLCWLAGGEHFHGQQKKVRSFLRCQWFKKAYHRGKLHL
jgi:hypothetical protein